MESSSIDIKGGAYEVRLDIAVLQSFYGHGAVSEVTQLEVAEVLKVIGFVFNVHYQKYYTMFKDLQQEALCVIMERYDRFDRTKKAYPYIYTMARNTIGNTLRRLLQEKVMDEIPDVLCSDSQKVFYDGLGELAPYLTGEIDYVYKDIAVGLIVPLLFFIEKGLCRGLRKVGDAEVYERLLDKIVRLNYRVKPKHKGGCNPLEQELNFN